MIVGTKSCYPVQVSIESCVIKFLISNIFVTTWEVNSTVNYFHSDNVYQHFDKNDNVYRHLTLTMFINIFTNMTTKNQTWNSALIGLQEIMWSTTDNCSIEGVMKLWTFDDVDSWKHKWNSLQFLSATNTTFLSEPVKISLHLIGNIFQLFVALNRFSI